MGENRTGNLEFLPDDHVAFSAEEEKYQTFSVIPNVLASGEVSYVLVQQQSEGNQEYVDWEDSKADLDTLPVKVKDVTAGQIPGAMEDNEVHGSQSSTLNRNQLQDGGAGEDNKQIFTIVCNLPKSEVSTAQVDQVEMVQGGDNWEVLTSVDIKNVGSKGSKLSQTHYSTAKQLQGVVVDDDAKDHMLLSKKELVKNPVKDERQNIFIVPDLSSCVDVSLALIEQKDVKREDIKSDCVAKDLNENYVKGRPSGTKRRSHDCNLCSYTTQKRYLLRRHMKTHSDERPFVCNVCERGFKTRAALQNHENVHTGRKPHNCNFCPASFTTSGELARHVRYRHTHEKPHKCPDCDYSAVELSKLKRHMRTHSGEKPFQCPHCSYASPDTFKLKRHLRIHTGDKPYECDFCSARFSQLDTLKDHRRTQHLKYKLAFQVLTTYKSIASLKLLISV